MNKLTVYKTPTCVRCGAATRKLDAEGVEYTLIDVTEDAEALERLKRNGKTEAPVFGWAGELHYMDQLPRIIREAKEQAA